MRDLIAYLLVVVIIVAVAYDGIVCFLYFITGKHITLFSLLLGLLAGSMPFTSAILYLHSLCGNCQLCKGAFTE